MSDSKSTYTIYRRLLKYAMPYRLLLAAGILAGAFTGLFSVGILKAIPGVIGQMKGGTTKVVACSDCGAESTISVEVKKKEKPDSKFVADAKEILKKLNPLPFIMEKLDIPTNPIEQKGNFRLMVFMISLLGFLLFMQMAMTVVNRFCMRWAGMQVVRDIRSILFRHIQKQSLSFYSKSDMGELISRVNNDTSAIERALSSTIADMTRAPFEILVVVMFLIGFTVDKGIYVLWAMVLVIVPVVFIPILHFSRRIKSHVSKAFQQISILNSRMHEVFTGIRIVKAFNMSEAECQRFDAVNQNCVKRILRALRSELAIAIILGLLNIAMACSMVIYCYVNRLDMADMMQLVMAAMFIYGPAKRLAKVNTQIQRSAAAAERIFEMLDHDSSIKEKETPVEISSFDESIVFENVSFAYKTEEPVLQDISFEMPKGKVVAFVGQAGCGKSTIANMIPRFYDSISGRVTIDGKDVKDLRIESLRDLIGIVTQDTILFNETIVSNIAYGDDTVDMDRVVEAATRARAHDFIMERDLGYDDIVGDKGFTLSGGQKQRLAIARALYRDPQILILDEATSALDSVTEQLVQDALNELMKDRTVFAIAHRLSTIRHAYKIFVLDSGRIVESGSHDELMALGGKYTQMTDIQDSN